MSAVGASNWMRMESALGAVEFRLFDTGRYTVAIKRPDDDAWTQLASGSVDGEQNGYVPSVEEPRKIGPLVVNLQSRQAAVGDTQLELTPKEWQLLVLLSSDPTRCFSKRTLLRESWGIANVEGVKTRAVDSHCSKLRIKLARAGFQGVFNVRGGGYRLCEPSPLSA